jgi:hypothetical protein
MDFADLFFLEENPAKVNKAGIFSRVSSHFGLMDISESAKPCPA